MNNKSVGFLALNILGITVFKVLVWGGLSSDIRLDFVLQGLVSLVQSMYKDVRSRVRVGDGYSEEFGVGVGVHQGSVLSPLLFIIVLEALSREFRTGCPWELLYADDLMISAGSMEELLVKVKTWKTEMEKKGLRVNMGKTKIMESGINLDVLKKSGKYPCGVCLTGVGRTNAIQCDGCKCWVHKKCSGIKGRLLRESEFKGY